MKSSAPQFELTRVMDTGVSERPEIVPVLRLPPSTKMKRRGFLGAGLSVSSAMGLLTGCGGGGDSAGGTSALPDFVSDDNRLMADPQIARKIRRCSFTSVAHEGTVGSLDFSPDGRFLASASGINPDHSIKLWELPSRRLATTAVTDDEFVSSSLVFTTDSAELIELSANGKVYARAMPDLIASRELADDPLISHIALHPHGVWFGAMINSGIEIRTIARGDLVRTIRRPGPSTFSFSPTGREIAVGAGTAIEVWDVTDGSLLKTLPPPATNDGSPQSLLFTPDGEKIVARYGGSNVRQASWVRVWSVSEASLLRSLLLVSQAVGAGSDLLALSPDGQILASRKSVELTLWNLTEYRHLATFEVDSSSGSTGSLAFDSAGQWLASGSSRSLTMVHIPSLEADGCFFDADALDNTMSATQYTHTNPNGQTVFYSTLSEAALPVGATCTCNTVQGTLIPRPTPPPRPAPSPGSRPVCTCNRVCTCVPVYCQAHKVTDPCDGIRCMAEQSLFMMGAAEIDYMRWAASKANESTRSRIEALCGMILAGKQPDVDHWPALDFCTGAMAHSDQIVRLMSAHFIDWKSRLGIEPVGSDLLIGARAEISAGQQLHRETVESVRQFAVGVALR